MVNRHNYLDTTFTKIFVGGLAWETRRDALRHYFEQFGEILEAVVICDKYSDKSKGYGFVSVCKVVVMYGKDGCKNSVFWERIFVLLGYI